jgi:predicted DNA-binding transcriptional regulator YafY
MKSEIFSQAIKEGRSVRFYYQLREVIIDPYFIFTEEDGTKALYGRSYSTSRFNKFDFERIVNIRLLPLREVKPIMPVSPLLN